MAGVIRKLYGNNEGELTKFFPHSWPDEKPIGSQKNSPCKPQNFFSPDYKSSDPYRRIFLQQQHPLSKIEKLERLDPESRKQVIDSFLSQIEYWIA